MNTTWPEPIVQEFDRRRLLLLAKGKLRNFPLTSGGDQLLEVRKEMKELSARINYLQSIQPEITKPFSGLEEFELKERQVLDSEVQWFQEMFEQMMKIYQGLFDDLLDIYNLLQKKNLQ